MTKHGKMIADVVLASHDHPTAEQIYTRIRENGGQISLATVYNNLKVLVAVGVLRRLSMDGSPDRFDSPGYHNHLICEHCGKLTDIHLKDLTDVIEQETGIHITSYDIRVSYLCDACKQKMKDEQKV